MRFFSIIFLTILLHSTAFASMDESSIDSLNSLGRAYIFSNIESSIEQYADIAVEAKNIEYIPGEARAYQNLGIALYLNGKYEEGVDVSLQAIRLFEELDLQRELAMTYGDLGYQLKRRNMSRATEFMRRGISIAEAASDSLSLCTLYDNFGVLREMVELPDSASFYYQLALDYKLALNDTLGIPYSLSNLSTIAARSGNMSRAKELLRESDRYRVFANDKYGLLESKVQWAEFSFIEGNLPEAVKKFENVLRLQYVKESSYVMSICYERLTEIFEKQKDYERAYQNHLRFTAYRDSMFSVESHTRMASLELEFETEKKDRIIAQSQLAISKRSRQIIFLVAALIIIFVAGLGAVRYQHLKQEKLHQEMSLRGQLKQAEHEQNMSDERLRISRELHDNIGAHLTFITSSIDNLSHGIENETHKNNLDAISNFGRTTLAELRQTVWAMKSEGEGFDALVDKFQELKQQCASTGRQLNIEVSREPGAKIDLSSGRMLNSYRIAQEAVQNSIKHTVEGSISVKLSASPDEMVLEIQDFGQGFIPVELQHVGGLAHMRQRCEGSGGTFEIESNSGGTRVFCRFPSK